MPARGRDTMRTRDTTARRMALAGILGLGGALALASAGPAAAAVPIMQCGTTIGTPGTYVLAADLTCPFGVIGIVVQADNVHLVLGKHSITLINRTGNGIYASNVTGLRIE